jgi:hypothetical protein
MCKIFVASGQFDKLDLETKIIFHEFMVNLFIATAHDGCDQDAAGFFVWSKKFKKTGKLGIPGINFALSDEEWLSLKENPGNLYLCHARGAMSSVVPAKNNHPFVGKNVALMHEGWISNYLNIALARDIKLETETDTELFAKIADARKEDGNERYEKTTAGANFEDYRNNWSPSKCMRSMITMTTEPTVLTFVDFSSRNPAIYLGKGSHSLHPYLVYRIDKFKGNFIVATKAMMDFAASLLGVSYKLVFQVNPYEILELRYNEKGIIVKFNENGDWTIR